MKEYIIHLSLQSGWLLSCLQGGEIEGKDQLPAVAWKITIEMLEMGKICKKKKGCVDDKLLSVPLANSPMGS